MRSRVKDLHDEYCKPKPKYHFVLWDSALATVPMATPEAEDEATSIDVYCHLVT